MNVRLVPVRVVVRDGEKRAVRNLTKDDFQLYDNGKLQTITKFSIETPGSPASLGHNRSPDNEQPTLDSIGIADRYVVYLFDDVHLSPSDLAQVRLAAEKHVAALPDTDRAAVFMTSGVGNLDFTNDRSQLRDALFRVQPRGRMAAAQDCPSVSPYMADLIYNQHDDRALAIATADAKACTNARDMKSAEGPAMAAAASTLTLADSDTLLAINALSAAVARLSATPGQRLVVLVSPGFLTPGRSYDVGQVIDRALRTNVIINSLDARGLYTINSGIQPNTGSRSGVLLAIHTQFDMAEAADNILVLEQVADGTGGTFVHNNNDLVEGLRRTTAVPECYYVLGFSPQNLKLDGRFHKLTVQVKKPGLAVQARKGYFAPKHAPDATHQAQEEIEEAVFSHEQVHELPVELRTRFFKASDDDATVSVLVHVHVRQLHFDKVEGRNRNVLTIVSALFDRDGKFVAGQQKVLTMRWKDETLATRLASGITLKSNFDVKPGTYLVRLVVRDDHGQLASQNAAVEIPYE